MQFQGIVNGQINPLKFRGHIFGNQERVLVLDVDGVLLEQKHTRKNGRRGKDIYKLNGYGHEIIERARKDHVDRIVLWTASPNALGKLLGEAPEFLKADQYIIGLDYSNTPPTKNLRILTPELRNVIAIEDDETFRPRSRVVYVRINPKDRLMKRYFEGLEKLSSLSS